MAQEEQVEPAETATTQPRLPLSKERVLQAAIALADEGGIEALSMRRLARELGVEAMSLYNHVENKDAILSGIVDAVVTEIETPSDVDWKAAIRRNAISARDMYLRHKWASTLSVSPSGVGPSQLSHGNWMLRTLREAGFDKNLVYHAFHILEAYVQGFTTQHLSFPYKGAELEGLIAGFLQQLSADEYPDLVEHVHEHLEPQHGDKGGFEIGLDLILDGLERMRDAEAA
jgi:AcrR family transcriptional regulator